MYFTDYGCTEACGKIATSLGETSPDAESLSRAGYPMPLFDVSVVKDTTTMSSVEWDDEDIGEVLVRGLTLGPKDNECWYCTGDLATVNASGSLNIVDRISDLIIVGGENVRASEVESVLMKYDGIAECAVFSQPDFATSCGCFPENFKGCCARAETILYERFHIDIHFWLCVSGNERECDTAPCLQRCFVARSIQSALLEISILATSKIICASSNVQRLA